MAAIRASERDALAGRVRALEAENAALRTNLEGERKARALLLAGMGSQAELMDALKQRVRLLEAVRAAARRLADDYGPHGGANWQALREALGEANGEGPHGE